MINPAGIPTIPGDMAVLAGHATALQGVGTSFASTGQQVNSIWQGLAGVYEAPEIGQLLAATAPVQSISSSVGEDLGVAGKALGAYAAEVAQIKARMAALRTQAEEFVASVAGDDDWTSDGSKVDRNRELVAAVDAEMAAFFEAQRRCANTINALYGGQQYTAENGDGQVTAGEYGYTAEQLNAAARQEGALPWGHADEKDRGLLGDVGAFFGGVWDGAVGLVTGLGALIGRDPTTGEWSWSTAGQAWQGLGTFALAVGVYAMPGGALLDQTIGVPGFERGQLGDTLLTAGKSIIAYDQWSEDPARAAGTATFNIVSAIVGTKGAGAGLRTVGAAAEGSRVAAVSAAGTVLVRSGEFIGRLPTVDDLAARAAGRLPGFHLPDLSATSRIDVPHHIDVPSSNADLPSGTRTPDVAPTPGTVGDVLSRTPDTPAVPPATSNADVPTPRSADTTPTHSTTDPADAPSIPSNDRTPALVGAHVGTPAHADHTPTGSGTDVPTGTRPDTDNTPPPDRTPDGDPTSPGDPTPSDATPHGDGDQPDGGTPYPDPDHSNSNAHDPPSDGRSDTDHMPPPEPGNRSLEVLPESRVERDADGLIESVDGRPVDEYLHDVGEQRAEQFRQGRVDEQFSRGDVGEVSAVVIDRRTGEVFEGTNGRPREEIPVQQVHPLLRERLEQLRAEGPYPAINRDDSVGSDIWPHPHPDRPLGHAEVKAVNELLWRHGADVGPEVFADLRVDNYFPFKPDGVRSAPCCANCSALLWGTPSNAGRFTGFPPGPHNFLPE